MAGSRWVGRVSTGVVKSSERSRVMLLEEQPERNDLVNMDSQCWGPVFWVRIMCFVEGVCYIFG